MAAYNIIYSSTADAHRTNSSAVYSTAREAVSATSTGAADNLGQMQNYLESGFYNVGQIFFVFDTSAVPSGSGTGFFSINISGSGVNADADSVRFRQVSSIANTVAGSGLSALTLHASAAWPSAGRYEPAISSVSAVPRTATFNVVMHSANQEAGTAPAGATNILNVSMAEATGTTNDPFLSLIVGGWQFVGVSSVVEVTATAHALVTTGISGLASGDLLIACISSRIASTTSVTLPTGGAWTLVSEQKNNNTLSTASAVPSGLMAYAIRGASNPNLTFTHPVAPSVAIGRIVAYRNVNTSSPKDTQTSFTTATGTTAVSGAGLTTAAAEDLLVAMAAGGQEAAWSAFVATDPANSSGSTDTTTAPTPDTWIERADSFTTTGADTSLAIFDAVKLTTGATGNLTATASVAAAHVVIAGAFKIAGAAAAKSLAFRTRSSRNFRQGF